MERAENPGKASGGAAVRIVRIVLWSIALLAGAVLLWLGLYVAGIVGIPDWAENLIDSKLAVLEAEDMHIPDSIRDRLPETPDFMPVGITKDDARQIIAALEREKTLYRTVRVERKGGGRRDITVYDCAEDVGQYRIVIKKDGAIRRLIAHDNGFTGITDYDSPGSFQSELNDDFSFEAQAGIPTLRYFLDADESEIQSAELFAEDGSYFVRIGFSYPELGQEEIYVISLRYGVVVQAESRSGGEWIYRMTTEKIGKQRR